MRKRNVRVAVAGALLAALASMVPAVAWGPVRTNYVVEFRAAPGAGQAELDSIEREVLRRTGVARDRLGYRYRKTLTGFSAHLTTDEAARLGRRPEVASVAPDRVRRTQPRRTEQDDFVRAALSEDPQRGSPGGAEPPLGQDANLSGQSADFLNLPEGLWSELGGPDHAGEDVIIGIIDTGIYPEHPSFADEPIAADGTRNYIGPAYGPPPADWLGTCQSGEDFAATDCNNKLIGARYFVDGWGAANVAPEDFLSPRDAEGHGTGMAGIAAGNYGVDPTFHGNDLGIGVISGIAPRARIAAYKALWAIPAFNGAGFGADSDLVAAVDAAVSDGVDVLSLSIGAGIDVPPFSNASNMLDPVGLALLRAYEAGIPSVLAAGNDGPDPETIESPGETPWSISVGSSALSTTFAATATVSAGPDGPTIVASGISPTPAVPAVPLVDARAAAAPGVNPNVAERCRPGSLDPALVRGKAVLCRPGSAVFPSMVLSDIGAAAGIFYFENLDRRYTVEDVWLPSIVVDAADGVAIRRLLASAPAATLALTAGTATPTTTGDIVVRSSARGPTFGSADVLKPDVLAPGEEVIAAQTPETPAGAGELFDFTQPGNLFRPAFGTSASTAAVSGSAALLLDLHPGMSPGAVKSALMTTAVSGILEDDVVPSRPAAVTDRGAGRIDPNRAADPGLVVSETAGRYREFVQSEAPTRDPAGPLVAATDLNLPSVAFEPLVGPRSTRRTFTSVDSGTGTWTASFEDLAGIVATAEPSRFSIEPGASQTVELTFDADDSPSGQPVDGALVLTNEQDGRTVRLPVALRPEAFSIPDQLNFGAATPDGHMPLTLPTDYEGTLTARLYGFAPPETRRDQTVALDESGNDDVSQPRPGVTVFDIDVPAGAQVLAAELGGAALADDLTELGLAVLYDAGNDGFTMDDILFDSSEVGLTAYVPDPSPGRYRISIQGLNAAPVATFDLTTWVIADPAPTLLADRLPATFDGTAALDLAWAGLTDPGVHLALVRYDLPVRRPDGQPWETVVAVTRTG